jgi:hypothetical protein
LGFADFNKINLLSDPQNIATAQPRGKNRETFVWKAQLGAFQTKIRRKFCRWLSEFRISQDNPEISERIMINWDFIAAEVYGLADFRACCR